MDDRRKLLILLATMGGVLLSALDGTATGTSMPRIVEQLHGEQSLTWVVTAYLLASTITIPVYGRLADLHGRKIPLLTGMTLFLVGSALCGLAQDMAQLIAFRVVQGVGAGALMTVGMTLVRDLYPPHESTGLIRMQTLMAGLMLISFVGGPLEGGLLTDHLGWRWIFLVNLPIGAAAIAVLAVLVPGGRPPGRDVGRFDVAGVLLLSAGIALVLVALNNSQGVLMLLAGLAVLASFIFVERRAAVPIVPLRLFSNRTYSAVSLAGFLFTVATMPAGLFIGLYFQQVRGLSATQSALTVIPLMVGMLIGNRGTAMIVLRTGRVKGLLAAGAILVAAASATLAMIDILPLWLTISCAALVGIGTAPAMGGIAIVAQTAVNRRDIGSATAGLNLMKQLGGSTGLAITQTLFTAGTHNGIAEAIGTTIAVVGVTGGLLALGAVLAMEDLDLLPARQTV
ncbi:MFS transporter [Actinocrispum wychmicini]|uniref:EmrB/QacA subfamily drug resistance transporter n=1 Tax=Actinocrispum wychmicini TaxID=1213861 RepID=A0A4V2S5K1_9PSEU|nr:MFS transporter [Actinocrispum wychmicini]TCO52390.1 EmrB/QacA subfamily drug resistance transporter [Actinocrispum wychmicini]